MHVPTGDGDLDLGSDLMRFSETTMTESSSLLKAARFAREFSRCSVDEPDKRRCRVSWLGGIGAGRLVGVGAGKRLTLDGVGAAKTLTLGSVGAGKRLMLDAAFVIGGPRKLVADSTPVVDPPKITP